MKDDFAQAPFQLVEFANNPQQRCACVLVLDSSGSMDGEPIAALNQGTELFAAELRGDRLTAKRVELAVIKCGDTAEVVAEFSSAEAFYPQPLTAKGGTPMGEAVEKAIGLVKARQAEYRHNGVPSYRPWIFLVTDGAPTDAWEKAARLIREGHERGSFSFFAVGVDDADMDMLAKLSVNAPLMLRGLAFSDMFRWLSSSLASVSRSSTGQPVALQNPAAPGGWAMIP